MGAAAEFAREIAAGGALADPAWRRAFEEVPRELFVPYYYAVEPDSGAQERRWRDDPDPEGRERWLRGVYADVPLATRIRDGELISSSSQPSLMARMLAALEVRDGMRVLEIGTGPGFNAALLCHRLGDRNVTTVDLDRGITDAARNHLAAAGYRPAVVTGDGARGCPAHAPYDRIIATCALPAVPLPWLAQCAPGALVLAPLATGLIALRVLDAEHASGRFLDTPAYFVPLRGAGPAYGPADCTAGLPAEAERSDSFRFLLALTRGRVPARAAYEIWTGEGRPERERYGLTVRGGEQWAWLDTPYESYAWPLGT
ncbi:methyltransferase domain-containing protein [Streptomyces armeniacus]|uniref:Protein-L-isoaspartate O-methyltransferase n=1 Tax=Streptomyces armeniacus TaxID=83291 RepID=A0A345XZ26_9ACTN|nr:methyltransferase domain-containing protein [Streptomyces armeniacus]AXK36892.1 methyltransferase domain-containing protein [Streptomyces armeniacus]